MDITHFRLRNKIINFYCETTLGLHTLRGENLEKYNELEKHKIFLDDLQPFENFLRCQLSCFIHMDGKINLAECKFSYAGLCAYIGGKWDIVSIKNFPYIMVVARRENREVNIVASKLAGQEIKGKSALMPLEHFRKLK